MADAKSLWIDGRLIAVSDEVYEVYTKGERKDRYITVDLKTEKIKVNKKKETVTFIPSREDSLERLLEDNDQQYADESENVEEEAVKNIMVEKLESVMDKLSSDEYELIQALYFRGLSERKWSVQTDIPQRTINDRKKKILKKLKKFLEN